MWMLRSLINIKITEDGAAKTCLRKHALYCMLYYSNWLPLKLLFYGSDSLTTRISCVVDVNLVVHFLAGEDDFLGIDYGDIIATITVGSIACLPLSS